MNYCPLLRHFLPILGTFLLPSALNAAPGWTMEKFTGITGGSVANLTGSAAFYAAPAYTTILASSTIPSNTADNYGTRICGYVTAPVTGLYTFVESGDDAVTLFLSPDENPANKQVIASHAGWTAPLEWYKYPTQSSRPIPLEAGRKYYIEVLQKEGGGLDNLAIAWIAPGSSLSLIPPGAMETYTPTIPSAPACLTREVYNNIPGWRIADLRNALAFPGSPSATTYQADGLAPSSVGDFYGVTLRGTVTPAVSGDYTFYESGDDDVQLYLSPTDNPADKQLIAHHTGYTSPLEWGKYPTQKSRSLSLTAGKSYYIEVLHKEGNGGDHLAIAWTPPGGNREILPASVLNAWKPHPTDQDDDRIADFNEAAIGLNPANRADATHDADKDGIPNLADYLSFADPLALDEVTGYLTDDIWFNLPGDKLNTASYKAAATRYPDRRSYVNTTQASDVGESYLRRVRGFITAPVTGSYEFWGAADDDVDFHLSTTSRKFQLRHIIRNNVRSLSFDMDPSQKSAPVTLEAGRKYYFELWHKEGGGGASVALAWKAPGGIREIIPSHFLSSFTFDPDDLDDDGLSDTYELANGLNPNDGGRSLGSTDGAYGDLDQDGLVNFEEQQSNTAANRADSDSDGVSDFDEILFFGSANLANSIGAFTTVATLAGDAYSASFGEWAKQNGKARQSGRRGSVTYPITVQKSGIHALKFTISAIQQGAKNEQHDFHLTLNGHHLAYKTITILPNGTSTLAILTPWLNAGETHNLELFVDNSYNYRRVSIDQLAILAAGGIDSNSNTTPDWTEIRVNDLNGLDTPGVIHSKTSPAVIEGKTAHPGLLTTNAPAPVVAPGGRFFTEVPLTQGTPTELDFAFENQALSQSATVHWLPTNLLEDTSLTVREGDSLLLTAFLDAENAGLENYSYTLNGETVTATADQPATQLFATPGSQTIAFTHTAADGTVTTSTANVTVLAKMSIEAPLCIVGYPRAWTPPALPADASLIIDPQVTATPATTSSSYTLATTTPINQPILIKSATGLILGSGEVKSASVRSSDMTGPVIIEDFTTYHIVEMPVITYGDLDNADIRCEIIIGGVTYADGTTTKTLKSSDFDTYGSHKLLFHKVKTAHSNCHRFSIWANGVRIANYN